MPTEVAISPVKIERALFIKTRALVAARKRSATGG